jgi:PAS domain S-box-containing protein
MKDLAASSEKVFSDFFDALPDAICAVRADGLIAILNSQAELMFGYSASELLGQPLEVLIPERFRGDHVSHRAKYVHDPRRRPMGAGLKLYGRKKDGAEFPVDIMLSPWDLGDQRLFVAVVRDVSERKKIEEALEKARQDLEVRVEQRTSQLTQANESLRDEAARLSAIIDTQQDLASAGRDLNGAMTLIVDKTQQLTGAGRVSIELIEHGKLAWRCGIDAPTTRSCVPQALLVSLAHECIRTGKALRSDDTETDRQVLSEGYRRLGWRSVVVAPLFHSGFAVGAFSILSSDPKAFGPRDERTLQLMAGLLSAAMSTAADFESQQALALERMTAVAALEARDQQRRAAAELGQHALEGRSFSVLLNDAVALVPQILGTEYCAVFEQLSDDQLILSAGAGWKEGIVGNTFLPVGRDSQAGYTLLSRAPVVVEDLRTEPRFHAAPLQLQHDIVSGISVLIHQPGKPFGVLAAYTRQKRSFSGDDVHFLQSIATILATAVGRRQLEEELLDAGGREQRRLGQDLHDGLCQHLIGLQYTTSVFAEKLEKASELRKEAEAIAELIRQGTLQARMLARGLSPVNLEANGLMSALRELALNTAALFRINCSFDCSQEVLVMDNTKAVQLYRIAQEAITNAVKHGQSTSVHLSLDRSGDHATLKITDNGVGFPPHTEKSSGMGLRIMQYRADMIGASLQITPGAERGTEVTCVFDINMK